MPIAVRYTHVAFFFFQAEDGIRDWSVTGVQTCALPIWPRRRLGLLRALPADLQRPLRQPVPADLQRQLPVPVRVPGGPDPARPRALHDPRSEERRVGKEGRSRWAASHESKNSR